MEINPRHELWFRSVIESFAHRYLNSETTGEILCQREGNLFYALAKESNLKLALKTPLETVQSGFKKNIKERSKEAKPTLVSGLFIQVHSFRGEGPGHVSGKVLLNWDFPHHSLESSDQYSLEENIEYDEVMLMRKELPLAFERMCEIF